MNKKKIYRDFIKVVHVAVSCKTVEQIECANNFVKNYRRFNRLSEYRKPFLYESCIGIMNYLIDTELHMMHGFHMDKNDQRKDTYPDVNQYLELPEIKFKQY